MMNKLLMKEQIEINENGSYFIELSTNLKEIYINDNVSCDVLIYGKNISYDTKIFVGENSNLFCQTFFEDVSSNIEIDLRGYRASIEVVCSMISKEKVNTKFIVNHNAKDTTSIFTNHIVNYKDELVTIQVDAYVPKNITGCTLNQDNKIILLGDGKGKILPNLFVDEYTAFAKHSAYISKFKKEELFYLKSRGISEEDANYLLTKSFLLGKMKLDSMFLQKFTEVLKKH